MKKLDVSRSVSASFTFAVALSALALVACSDSSSGDDDSSNGDSCDVDSEVQVAHVDDNAEGPSKCVAKPSECSGSDPCDADACRAALYDLCDDGWIGVACSSSEGSAPIVSCNQ